MYPYSSRNSSSAVRQAADKRPSSLLSPVVTKSFLRSSGTAIRYVSYAPCQPGRAAAQERPLHGLQHEGCDRTPSLFRVASHHRVVTTFSSGTLRQHLLDHRMAVSELWIFVAPGATSPRRSGRAPMISPNLSVRTYLSTHFFRQLVFGSQNESKIARRWQNRLRGRAQRQPIRIRPGKSGSRFCNYSKNAFCVGVGSVCQRR